MERCFDRANETQQFLNTSKRVIALVDCKGNGTTVFLKNKLENKPYIFVTENYNHEIIMTSADSKIESSKDNVEQFTESCINELEQIKFLSNFLCIDTCFNSFFKDIINDSITNIKRNLKSLNNFINFFEFYCKYYDFKKYGYIYTIIDKANSLTPMFIRNIFKLIYPNDKVKIVFTFTTPYIPSEYNEQFRDCEVINFCKPTYENAKIIFKNLELNNEYISKQMYEQCVNFEEFQKKYNEISKERENNSFDVITLYIEMLKEFNCRINKYLLQCFHEYIYNNGFINEEINFDVIFNKLHKNTIISLSEGIENIKINLIMSKIQIKIDFISFIHYLLSKENYDLLNYDTMYYIYSKIDINLPSNFILKLFIRSTNKQHIQNILKDKKIFINNSSDYFIVYSKLYNMKLFNLIQKISNKMKREKICYKITDVLLKEKKHQKTFDYIYKKYIKENTIDNIDLSCLMAIIYFDYCTNHKRKNLKSFFDINSIYYYKKFIKSKYYYILENIVSFNITNLDDAIKSFDHSISICSNIDKDNIAYFLNNKFVYLLKEYCYGNIEFNNSILNELYNKINDINNDEILSLFVQNNLGLYLSLKTQKNMFAKNNNNLEDTWILFNEINSLIFNFQCNNSFSIDDYIKLEQKVLKSNRIPTKILYYYNLYVISKKYKIPFASKIKMRLLLLNSNNYKNTDVYNKFIIAKKENKLEELQKLVKYGFITSRVFNIDYLLNEIDIFIK